MKVKCIAINSFQKKDGLFTVSTCNRTSNAPIAYGIGYSETFVFFYANDTYGPGDIVWRGEHMEGSLYCHNRVSEWLRDHPSMDGFDDQRAAVYEQIRG